MIKTSTFALAALLIATTPSVAETVETSQTIKTTTVSKTENPVIEKKLSAALGELQSGWEKAKYQIKGKDAQLDALSGLEQKAMELAERHPANAEAKVWYAAILSTEAAIIDGMSALPKVNEAKKQLDAALALDSSVMKGYGHTSLGALYARVPGWPIAFGNKNKAELHLKKALTLDPASIDANYYYGDFLTRKKDYAAAIPYLEKAINAPDRPGRSIADEGRRAEARALLEEARNNINRTKSSSYN